MKKIVLYCFASFLVFAQAISQNVAVNSNGQAPHTSAILDLSSTSKGLLIPRMTAAQRTAIAGPATGLLVYQTDGTVGLHYYNGNTWVPLNAPNANLAGWSTTGNTAINPATEYFGTTDNTSVSFRTNGQQRMWLDANGKFGVGTVTPQSLLDVYGTDPTTANAAFRAVTSGDNNRAADIMNLSATTVQPALLAYVIGANNNAGMFYQANANSTKAALAGFTNGTGGAGYFSTVNNAINAKAILTAEYTGASESKPCTAIMGLANVKTGWGVGGHFEGGYYGIHAKGQIAGKFDGVGEGIEVNLQTTNGGSYQYGIDVNVTNTANVNVMGISSFVQGGTAQNVIGIYSEPQGGAQGASVYAFYGSGHIGVTGSYLTVSDAKLKQNIKPLHGIMDKIMLLKPSTYEYRTEEYKRMNLPKGNQFGLLAQDLQAVFPELVTKQIKPDNKNDKAEGGSAPSEYLGVNYPGLVPILISGLQDLKKENDELKKEIAAIKAKLGL